MTTDDQTLPPDDGRAPQPIPRIYLWMCSPDGQPEQLCMVQVHDDAAGGMVFRPLMAIDDDTALQLEPHAQDAADSLGVPVILRMYDLAQMGVGGRHPYYLSRVDPR
jgi:hypothetical protein